VPVKSAPEHLSAAKSDGLGDRLERLGTVLEQVARTLDAQGLDIGTWGLPDLALKHSSEGALAHQHAFSERGNRKVLVQLPRDPCLKLAHLVPNSLLGGERIAELRLPTRPFEEHHEIASRGERDPWPEIVLHQ